MTLSTTKGNLMTTTTTFTDQELIDAFLGERAGKIFRATFIPADAPYPSVSLWDERLFKAAKKKEALKIAREYGERIIDKKMIYVYLGARRW
jgi:hypothetical protein